MIVQKKEINFQTLVGYVGGYIGIFTGFAISQIPDFIVWVLGWAKMLKTSCQSRNDPNTIPDPCNQW